MFSTVRRFLKTGLVFLAFGLLLGAFLLVQREIGGTWPSRYLISAHVHAVGVGFIMFMILGVALWLFPRPPKEDTRYRPERISLSYWLLTASTAGRLVAEVTRVWEGDGWLRVIVLLTGLGQLIGLAVYFHTMWSRIRPVGSHLREAKGERF